MLDAGCWLEHSGNPVFSGAFQDFSNSEIEKHPVSRGQYPVSANANKGFRCNDLDEKQDFMQLEGKLLCMTQTVIQRA